MGSENLSIRTHLENHSENQQTSSDNLSIRADLDIENSSTSVMDRACGLDPKPTEVSLVNLN